MWCRLCVRHINDTHTCLTALCPGQSGWADTRKGKPIWILLKQETVSGSDISWAICKSWVAPDRQPRQHSVFLQARCPSCCPTDSVKALKAHKWAVQKQLKQSQCRLRERFVSTQGTTCESATKWPRDNFSCFCIAQSRQTDRHIQTDHSKTSEAADCIQLVLQCGLNSSNEHSSQLNKPLLRCLLLIESFCSKWLTIRLMLWRSWLSTLW